MEHNYHHLAPRALSDALHASCAQSSWFRLNTGNVQHLQTHPEPPASPQTFSGLLHSSVSERFQFSHSLEYRSGHTSTIDTHLNTMKSFMLAYCRHLWPVCLEGHHNLVLLCHLTVVCLSGSFYLPKFVTRSLRSSDPRPLRHSRVSHTSTAFPTLWPMGVSIRLSTAPVFTPNLLPALTYWQMDTSNV